MTQCKSQINNITFVGAGECVQRICASPHVDMKRLGFVDLEASRPGTVGGIHETHTKELVVVVAGPVENNAGAWQGGDVTLWIGRTLG